MEVKLHTTGLLPELTSSVCGTHIDGMKEHHPRVAAPFLNTGYCKSNMRYPCVRYIGCVIESSIPALKADEENFV